MPNPTFNKKATHMGSCQACGREQKLPGDVLSKHGYHVQWKIFVGECPGCGHKPYEQDCSLIQRFIDDARGKLAGVKANIADNLRPAVEPKCWYHEYIGSLMVIGRYVWRQIALIAQPRTVNYGAKYGGECTIYDLTFVNHEGKVERYPEGTTEDVLKTATEGNTKYVQWELEPYKKQLENYIRWQTERVNNWKLTDLKPVPPEVPPDPNRKPRRRRW